MDFKDSLLLLVMSWKYAECCIGKEIWKEYNEKVLLKEVVKNIC